MKVTQHRTYTIDLDESEFPPSVIRGVEVAVSRIVLQVANHLAIVTFIGTYEDPLDGGKIKPFKAAGAYESIVKADPIIEQFFDRLPLVRVDELPLGLFVSSESPVG